ncbi:MAG: gliding motility-associated C-terminal domain-containing protein [Cytophagaceae bacterium]
MNKSFTGLVLLIFFICFQSQASHIVGGEFQLKYKRGYNYEIILRMYFDDINAQAGLLTSDIEIDVAIYQKSNNFLMTPHGIKLKQVSNNFIGYVHPECSAFDQNTVRTRLLYYTTPDDIQLDPCVYNDPGGYYIVWERCCRNATIKNIFTPDEVGNAFYLEFPPTGNPSCTSRIINTSPLFTQVTGEFPCLNQPFNIDFGAFDPDGDSLVYRMVTPQKGYAIPFDSEPFPDPGPYPDISWNFPYGTNNQIPGSPPLSVNSRTGLLSVTPSETGLFAFAMEVDEYRNGVKIGMIRRDFQFLVINCPNLVAGPKIDLKKPAGGFYAKGDTITIHLEKDTCFSAVISDSATTLNGISTTLNIESIKTNLPAGIVTFASGFNVTPANDSIISPLCFDACKKLFIHKDSAFYLNILIKDHQCPNPKKDTLTLVVLVKAELNTKPKIKTLPSPAVIPGYYEVGDSINFTVIGTDVDHKDRLTLTAEPQGFSLGDYGMVFPGATGHDSIASPFSWIVPCGGLTPGQYKIVFRISDATCTDSTSDTLSVSFKVKDKETTFDQFIPPNLITPNGDNMNDLYRILNLPGDNCTYYFVTFTVFNRWGAKVFESRSRDFSWDASSFPDGMYYYVIDLNAKKVKGWLEVLK